MKALRFAQTGSLDALECVDIAQPEPGAEEVLVRVHAAGLNPSDLKNVLGRFPYTTLPRVPGRDFAGIVAAGPPDWVGKAVWGSGSGVGFSRDGSHAQYLLLPADAIAEKPGCLSFAQAAACGVPWLTAWESVERASIQPACRVVIIGATGAVGRAATALALARGATVIGAVRRKSQLTELPQAVHGLLLDTAENLTTGVNTSFGSGADVIIDTTGFWLAASVALLANGGRIVVIAAPASGIAEIPLLDFYRRGGSLIGVNSLLHKSASCARILTEIGQLFATGKLPLPPEPRQWPLDDGVAAYRALATGGIGKIVLTG